MAASCIWPELMTWILAKWTQLEAGDRYRYLDTSWQHFILDTDNDPLELYVSMSLCQLLNDKLCMFLLLWAF